MIAIPEQAVETGAVDAHLQYMFLQGLADQMREPVLIGVPGHAGAGRAGTIVYANEAATDLMGCSFEMLVGKSLPMARPHSPLESRSVRVASLSDRFRSSRFGSRLTPSPADLSGTWRQATFRDGNGETRYMLYVLPESE